MNISKLKIKKIIKYGIIGIFYILLLSCIRSFWRFFKKSDFTNNFICN